jgi:hypothetical protein
LCYRDYYLVALGIGIAPPQHWHCSHSASALLPLDIFIPGSSVLHPSSSASPSFLVSASPFPRYQHPCSLSIALLGIGILAPSASPHSRYQHPLALGISTPSLSVSATPRYQYWHPCSIGIPSLSVSASQVSRYRTPQCQHLSHFTTFGIWHRCPSPALELLSSTPPQSLPPLASFPYTLPTPLSITATPTHQPTSFIETHKHSLRNRALYSYTALQPPDAPRNLYLLNHQAWTLRISQVDSGKYCHRMDISFAVAGLLVDTLHLPNCEGVEFESGIRAVMKRCKENRARQQDSNV